MEDEKAAEHEPEPETGPPAEDAGAGDDVPPDEPQAGPLEIAAAVFVILVMAAGLTYSWFQGKQTGYAIGLDEGKESAAVDPARIVPKGLRRSVGAVLGDGQKIRMILEGPDKPAEEITLDASAGDSVLVYVGHRIREAPKGGSD